MISPGNFNYWGFFMQVSYYRLTVLKHVQLYFRYFK